MKKKTEIPTPATPKDGRIVEEAQKPSNNTRKEVMEKTGWVNPNGGPTKKSK